MKKSLFLKQFTIYMLILLLSFAALALILTNAFKQYHMQQMQELLIQQAERITQQYADGIYTGVIDMDKIETELMVLSDTMGASTVLVGESGKVVFVSEDIDSQWIGKYVDKDSLMRVLDGETVVTKSNFNNIFANPALTILYPVKTHRWVFAALIMNISVEGIATQIQGVYLSIVGMLAVCAIVTFLALYFSVARITKPIKEINQAARVIADGNFEKRIETGLTDEVGQLAHSFNEMAESLSTQEESKRRFIANISHDIRSPLTSIQGFVTAMLDGTAPPESFDRYLHIVKDESARIIKLANEMIEVNSIEEPKAAIEPTVFDINDLIRRSAEQFENNIKQKELSMEMWFAADQTMVRADREKIERVLTNLMDNAVKFTQSGKISVETECAEGKAWVSVKDTGIGMSPEQQARVFERFYKADDSRGEHRTGNGLGLSIVKEFIKAHGETIVVKSQQGQGSEFRFSLPLA